MIQDGGGSKSSRRGWRNAVRNATSWLARRPTRSARGAAARAGVRRPISGGTRVGDCTRLAVCVVFVREAVSLRGGVVEGVGHGRGSGSLGARGEQARSRKVGSTLISGAEGVPSALPIHDEHQTSGPCPQRGASLPSPPCPSARACMVLMSKRPRNSLTDTVRSNTVLKRSALVPGKGGIGGAAGFTGITGTGRRTEMATAAGCRCWWRTTAVDAGDPTQAHALAALQG